MPVQVRASQSGRPNSSPSGCPTKEVTMVCQLHQSRVICAVTAGVRRKPAVISSIWSTQYMKRSPPTSTGGRRPSGEPGAISYFTLLWGTTWWLTGHSSPRLSCCSSSCRYAGGPPSAAGSGRARCRRLTHWHHWLPRGEERPTWALRSASRDLPPFGSAAAMSLRSISACLKVRMKCRALSQTWSTPPTERSRIVGESAATKTPA
mmetsp:Transcript_30825/g.98275  ORF Transcript_30825/g.98275 Transcript_30825/m.98275 type:complete len:206 (+) Transcript_30825:466-1083(+)